MHYFCDINEVLTPDLFESLAEALHVRWPDWYRQLVFALLEPPPQYADRWLPGGFLFANPQLSYQSTIFQRQTGMSQRTEVGSLVQAMWPSSHIIVGHYGEGDVVIDASSDIPAFLNLYKEDYTLRPFMDLREMNKTPIEFARLLREGQQRTR